ncbi:MAG: nuclear transport factor 2 family protein [Myxococcota bacterium]
MNDHRTGNTAAAKGSLNETRMLALAEGTLADWNTQDPDRVLGRYMPDLIYRDPNTRGEVKGAEAMKRYLTELFGAWKMHWALREAHLFEDRNGCAVLWHATFQKPDGEQTVEIDGMDLVLMTGDRIRRNEVWFDRAALAPLL